MKNKILSVLDVFDEAMRSLLLKKITDKECHRLHSIGKISTFNVVIRDFLLARCDWPDLTSKDLPKIRQRFELTQADIAKLIGVSTMRVIRWENGTSPIPQLAVIFFSLLNRFGVNVLAGMEYHGDPIGPFVEKDNALPTMPLRPLQPPETISISVSKTPTEHFSGLEIKTLRLKLGLSRKSFAEILHVTRDTVDKWERDAAKPLGPAIVLLQCLERYGIDFLSQK